MVDIKVSYAGLCGSDIAKINNESNLDIRKLGHEIVGSIVGQENLCYVINPFVCRQDCCNKSECNIGSLLFCPDCKSLGKQLQGGFVGQLMVPYENLFGFNVDDRYKCVGTLVDGLAVIFHGLHQVNIVDRSSVLVSGAGAIGCLAAFVLKKRYPHINLKFHVRNENKRDVLIELFDKEIISTLEGCEDRFDIVFECVGGHQSKTIDSAIDMTKKDGAIIVFGAFTENINAPINYRKLFYKQILLKGINSYCKKYNDFSIAVEFAKQYCEELYQFVTLEVAFDNIEQYICFDLKKDYKRIKTVFVNDK